MLPEESARNPARGLPRGIKPVIVEGVKPAATKNLRKVFSLALDFPEKRFDLRRAVKAFGRVTVVVPDTTRPLAVRAPLEVLLERMERLNVQPEDVTIVVATGLHRPLTGAELRKHVGGRVKSKYRVLNHEASGAGIVKRRVTASGVPVELNRLVVDTDSAVSIGCVELHQYAGFSGGEKTVAIGCAGEKTIAFTHSPRMIFSDGVALGAVEGNPFRKALVEIAARSRLKYALNAVLSPDGRVIDCAAGRPSDVYERLVKTARSVSFAEYDRRYRLVVAHVPPAKASNLYQASRAASYLALSASPVVARGGAIAVVAGLPEGAGKGVGEERFYLLMREMAGKAFGRKSAKAASECGGGSQRAHVMAKVLSRHTVAFIGSACPRVVEECGFVAAPTLSSFVKKHFGAKRPSEALIVPDVFATLPVYSGRGGGRR